MWAKDINIYDVKEIRTRTTVYFGVGAISKISDIANELKSRGIDKIIVISGRSAYKTTGAWGVVEKALKSNGIKYVNYDKVTPNPTNHQIDEAAKVAKDFGAQGVIAIGGGSPIDAGKSVAILLEYPDKNTSQLYEFEFVAKKAAPIIAINLTHGTGTETNRFAVATIVEKEFKPAIAYDCIYPLFSIDDPQLMTKLSPEQTRYVSIDAVNHVIEAATSNALSPFAVTLARETIRLVSKYLPMALNNPEDLEARYFLAYAALLGGICFDNGLLHYTHALEHPLSAIRPELSHGLGLAILLPAVIKNIYNERAHILADILRPIAPALKGEVGEAELAGKTVERWLFSVGVTSKLENEGFNEADIPRLVDLTFTTPSLSGLLSLAPNEATRDRVESIYQDAMKAYNL